MLPSDLAKISGMPRSCAACTQSSIFGLTATTFRAGEGGVASTGHLQAALASPVASFALLHSGMLLRSMLPEFLACGACTSMHAVAAQPLRHLKVPAHAAPGPWPCYPKPKSSPMLTALPTSPCFQTRG